MKNCPSCNTEMKTREGKFGEFLFCPNQHVCKQKTITVKKTVNHYEDYDAYPEPSHSALEGEMLRDPLYQTASGLLGSMDGMARIAYENEREHEYTRNRAQVDGSQVLFGGGMFCDMGMEDDDEDVRPW